MSDIDAAELIKQLVALTASATANKIKLAEKETKQRSSSKRSKRISDQEPGLYDRMGMHGKLNIQDLVLRAHYDAHNLNETIPAPTPTEYTRDNKFVFCYYHRCTHPLSESVYVTITPIIGAHWCCRTLAAEHNHEEVIIK